MQSYLSLHALMKRPVVTQSGTELGRVVDVECDAEDMRIERFLVHPAGLSGLLREDLLVHRSQIIEITKERIIVEDMVIPKSAEARARPDPA